MPQLTRAIAELQSLGYAIPDYPENPSSDKEKEVQTRYNRVKGSAVNPVLREGNSDRRAPKPVKAYAQKHPHRMGKWTADSQSHVSTMSAGDFRSNELSVTLDEACSVDIIHVNSKGVSTTLKASLKLEKGEIIDGTYMSKNALLAFLK